jgi:hypothetical protein
MKTYSIVGMDHTKSEEFVKNLQPGIEAVLVREPHNPFDPLAVAVWIENRHVGYIPRKQNSALAKRIDETGGDWVEPHDGKLAADSDPYKLICYRAIPAKFVRSPNSGWPLVQVSE